MGPALSVPSTLDPHRALLDPYSWCPWCFYRGEESDRCSGSRGALQPRQAGQLQSSWENSFGRGSWFFCCLLMGSHPPLVSLNRQALGLGPNMTTAKAKNAWASFNILTLLIKWIFRIFFHWASYNLKKEEILVWYTKRFQIFWIQIYAGMK